MYQIKICHLYPELLNLYGDRGNIIALKKRCEWRGIDADVFNVSIGGSFNPGEYDIIFLGGGQDYEQEILQNDLLRVKSGEIKSAIEAGKIFLCICGGYQLLGHYYRTWDGREIECLGALDLWTIGGRERMIGNIVFECDFLSAGSSGGRVVGFENHSGKTYLGKQVRPMGRVITGFGNNGEDRLEGAVYKNVYCSYSHGSLLPKNPDLADHLITLALRNKYGDHLALEDLDDSLEKLAHDSMTGKLRV